MYWADSNELFNEREAVRPRHVDRTWADVAEEFGARVAAQRTKLGLTQEKLAAATGISRNQIQNIERSRNNNKDDKGRPGPGNPTMDTVFALANALQVDVAFLLTGQRVDADQ